jgi:hypothetical protein
MSVLAYYRAEWTDVAFDDEQHRIALTEDLRSLIRGCMRAGMSVPNAAKEVEILIKLLGGVLNPKCDDVDP